VQGFDKVPDASVRLFFYLPLMHSEIVEDQDCPYSASKHRAIPINCALPSSTATPLGGLDDFRLAIASSVAS
jgi:hypothetical protein